MVTVGVPVGPAEKAVAPLDKIVVFPPAVADKEVAPIVQPPIVPAVEVIVPVIVAEVATNVPAGVTLNGAVALLAYCFPA